MKKIILFSAAILAIAIFSGYKQSAQNEQAEKKRLKASQEFCFCFPMKKERLHGQLTYGGAINKTTPDNQGANISAATNNH